MMNTGFPGPRNVTPNQFLRQSPSPSAPSPAGLGAPSRYIIPYSNKIFNKHNIKQDKYFRSNQMVASPALVPSPSPQHAIMTGPSRSVNSVGKFKKFRSYKHNRIYRIYIGT